MNRVIVVSRALLITAVLGGSFAGSQSRGTEHRITVEEARKLVLAYLHDSSAKDLPGLGVSHYTSRYWPGFYFFEATWNNPNPGSVVVGHFAVDPGSADVWDPFSCKVIESNDLRSAQRKLRQSMRLPDAVKHKRKAKPC
jgi:hypothetical protein